MRIRQISAAAIAVACLAAGPAFAGQKTKPPKPPKTVTAKTHTAKAHTAKAHTAKAHTAKTSVVRGPRPLGDSVATSIRQRPEVASRVRSMLPGGMTIVSAANGFRNDGQFVAALHASRNLNIPFVTLKDAMTGSNPVTLGQAIHVLRPSVDANAEANRAEMQATSTLRR